MVTDIMRDLGRGLKIQIDELARKCDVKFGSDGSLIRGQGSD